MRRLIALCLLWLMTIPVMGQTADPAATIYEPLTVSDVRLTLDETDGISLTFGASPVVCEPLLVDVTQVGQFIDVTVFAPRTDEVCNTVAPFEPVITIPPQQVGITYVITINNYTSRFFLSEVDAETSDEPFAALWGQETPLIPFDMVISPVSRVAFEGQRDNLTMVIAGDHPDGCETDEFARLRPDRANPTLLTAEMVRLLPQGAMCPAALVAFEEQVSLSRSDIIIEANGSYTRIDDGRPVNVVPQPITIEVVEILDTGAGSMVVVSGDQTGDCAVDVQSAVVERDYLTLIELYAFSTPDAACDAAPFFTDAFIVDVLPVIVNGVAYDENGMIEPLNIGQGGGAIAPEGNFMPVETVIESVEVAVLESFPMQLQLTVSGFQPDGCDFPVEVEQTVEGNDVTLRIFRNVPGDVMCPAILNPYDETIMIDGTFEGGTVNIRVNSFETSVDL